MREVIDVARDVGAYAVGIADAGVKTVIRYYNNRNSERHPTKCLTGGELNALFAAGLSVAVVFEQGGGANGRLEDLTASTGERDGKRAKTLADALGQPAGSAIYFAVDDDYYKPAQLAQITSYFAAAVASLDGKYLCGCYGSGTVGRHLRKAGLVDYVWLAGAAGWSGTRQVLEDGTWSLFQKDLEQIFPVGRFDHDANIVNPAFPNFGQFDASGVRATEPSATVAALYRVAARSGLNLRSGPDVSFRAMETIPSGTIVVALSREGEWLGVDLQGDGVCDGFLFAGLLEQVSGGLPLKLGAIEPITVAEAELALDVQEIPGPRHNPRILLYHSTTAGGAEADETAWCSSFVNYCVEQAGLRGVGSKRARRWHDGPWGRDVTNAPRRGDIVVWRRYNTSQEGGHVAFFLDRDETSIRVLGGNQGDRVCIQTYPVQGTLGDFNYTLLSIRRA